jgi:hypothetical protein
MIYWLLGITLIIVLLIAVAFYRKYKAKQNRLAEIRDKWGKPYFNDQNFSLIKTGIKQNNQRYCQ